MFSRPTTLLSWITIVWGGCYVGWQLSFRAVVLDNSYPGGSCVGWQFVPGGSCPM